MAEKRMIQHDRCPHPGSEVYDGGCPACALLEARSEVLRYARQVIDQADAHNLERVVLEKALELACQDAWPQQPQWPALYLKKARADVTRPSAQEKEKP